MGGPDRPRGRAEQCSGEGLCLEEGGGRGVVGGVVGAVCERVADGGCHCRQVSRYDLCRQRLTLTLLPQGQLDLPEGDKTQSGQSRSPHVGKMLKINAPKSTFPSLTEFFIPIIYCEKCERVFSLNKRSQSPQMFNVVSARAVTKKLKQSETGKISIHE